MAALVSTGTLHLKLLADSAHSAAFSKCGAELQAKIDKLTDPQLYGIIAHAALLQANQQ